MVRGFWGLAILRLSGFKRALVGGKQSWFPQDRERERKREREIGSSLGIPYLISVNPHLTCTCRPGNTMS